MPKNVNSLNRIRRDSIGHSEVLRIAGDWVNDPVSPGIGKQVTKFLIAFTSRLRLS